MPRTALTLALTLLPLAASANVQADQSSSGGFIFAVVAILAFFGSALFLPLLRRGAHPRHL